MKNVLGAILLSLSAFIGFTAITSTTASADVAIRSNTAISTNAGFLCKNKLIKAVGQSWPAGSSKVMSKYSPSNEKDGIDKIQAQMTSMNNARSAASSLKDIEISIGECTFHCTMGPNGRQCYWFCHGGDDMETW